MPAFPAKFHSCVCSQVCSIALIIGVCIAAAIISGRNIKAVSPHTPFSMSVANILLVALNFDSSRRERFPQLLSFKESSFMMDSSAICLLSLLIQSSNLDLFL